jgi:uncharacterized membrane protein required for colicin V production
MFDLILIITLLFGIFIGLNRGFILQFFHLIGFITAFIVAAFFYDNLAEELKLWIPYQDLTNQELWPDFLQMLPVESAFYSIVSFAIIFFAVKIVLQIVATMLDFVASIPLIKSVNKILGAALGFLEVYLIAFIILFVLALTPVEWVQTTINNSSIALFILEKTPYFSSKLFELIQTYVMEEAT